MACGGLSSASASAKPSSAGTVLRIVLQRWLKRFHGVGRLVLLEKQLAPRRIDRRIGWRFRERVAKHVVRFLRPVERSKSTRRTRQLGGGVRPVRRRGDLRQNRFSVGLAEHLLQEAKLKRSFARRQAIRGGAQQRLGVRVAAACDHRARFQRDDVGIVGIELVGERIDFVVAAFDECASGLLKRRRGRAARRLRVAFHRKCDDGDQSEHRRSGEAARHRDSYYI